MNPAEELFSLEDKVALVTGSTRGIGRKLAGAFANAGAKVWIHGRDEEEGRTLAEEIEGAFVRADLSRSEEVQALAEAVSEAEERLDVLVNNAGVEIVSPVEALDMDSFDLTWRVNVRAPVQLVKLLLPLMRRAPAASVVNVTSIHDAMPYPNNSMYSTSKAALAMFTKTAAVELAPYGVRVNNLAPGAVETEINREVIEEVGREKFAEWIPLGRVASVEEMVGPALFLASDASSYMTGATLYADGGYMRNLLRYRPEAEQ